MAVTEPQRLLDHARADPAAQLPRPESEQRNARPVGVDRLREAGPGHESLFGHEWTWTMRLLLGPLDVRQSCPGGVWIPSRPRGPSLRLSTPPAAPLSRFQPRGGLGAWVARRSPREAGPPPAARSDR